MTRLHPRLRWIVAAIVLIPALVAAPWMYTRISTAPAIAPATHEADHADAALVLGARVYPDGTPSRFLRERIEVGVGLYEAGEVDTILMSGDGDDSSGFGEPTVMREVAESMGVPADAIIEDPRGLDTFSSCQRAHDVYGMDSVIVSTQEFHMPRSVWSCQHSGLNTQGRYPGPRPTRSTVVGNLRELAATAKTILDQATGRVAADAS